MFANADDGSNKLFANAWEDFLDRSVIVNVFRLHLSAFFHFVFVYSWTDNFINRREFRNFSYNVDDSSRSKHPWTRILLSVNEITIARRDEWEAYESWELQLNSCWPELVLIYNKNQSSSCWSRWLRRSIVASIFSNQTFHFSSLRCTTSVAHHEMKLNSIMQKSNQTRFLFPKRPEVWDENFN